MCTWRGQREESGSFFFLRRWKDRAAFAVECRYLERHTCSKRRVPGGVASFVFTESVYMYRIGQYTYDQNGNVHM